MRNFLFGVVFAVLVLMVLLRVGTPLAAQQDSRLRLHAGIVWMFEGYRYALQAVCDTGNGTMVYVGGRSNGGITSVLGGCTKQ